MAEDFQSKLVLDKEQRRLEQNEALADAMKEKVKDSMVESLKAGTGKNLAREFLKEARDPKPLEIKGDQRYGGYAEVTGLGDTPWADSEDYITDDEY